MTRSLRLCGLALLGLIWLSAVTVFETSVAAAESNRPNILFLFADDQRADAIEAWGNPHIKTPRLNELVARGLSFRNNYCFGSNSGAVCLPSRAMVHTGKSWLQSNPQMTGEQTLGELLQTAGYRTFATGKWHNGKPSLLRSFAEGQHIFMGGMCDHTQVPTNKIEAGELVSTGVGPKDSSELFADAAIEFLERQKAASEPFFAYISFTSPHDPRNPPEEFREMYYRSPPPLPVNFLPQSPINTGSLTIRDEQLAPWPRTEAVVQQQLCEYYGLISHLDQQVGRILDALAALPQADNTLIVYAADHGLAVGSHGLLGKQSLYEHCMKCPLIFCGPGIPENRQSTAFTYLYDIFPTLCHVAGVAAPEKLDGIDLTPLWTSETKAVREVVFMPYQKEMRSIRDERWKLIVYPQINARQLFDLEKDPHELHNLADNPDWQPVVEKLLVRLRAEQQRHGDQQELTSANPKPRHIDLTGHKRSPDPHQPEWIVEKYFE